MKDQYLIIIDPFSSYKPQSGTEIVNYSNSISFRFAYEKTRRRVDSGEEIKVCLRFPSREHIPSDIGKKAYPLEDLSPSGRFKLHPIADSMLDKGEYSKMREGLSAYTPREPRGLWQTILFVLDEVYNIRKTWSTRDTLILARDLWYGKWLNRLKNTRWLNDALEALKNELSSIEGAQTILNGKDELQKWITKHISREITSGDIDILPLIKQEDLPAGFQETLTLSLAGLKLERVMNLLKFDVTASIAEELVAIGILEGRYPVAKLTELPTGFLQKVSLLHQFLTLPIPSKDKTIEEWTRWALKFAQASLAFDLLEAKLSDASLVKELEDKIQNIGCIANKIFSDFIEEKYPIWLMSKPRPPLVCDILQSRLLPLLEKDMKVFFIIFDGMSLEEATILVDELRSRRRKVDFETCIAIIPSITIYSRNSIFAGMLPSDIERDPDLGVRYLQNNQGERLLLLQFLTSRKLPEDFEYFNFGSLGSKNRAKLREAMKKQKVVAMVLRLVDVYLTSAPKTELDKSMMRGIFKIALEKTEIMDALEDALDYGFRLIITSDHGNIDTKQSIQVELDPSMRWEFEAHSRFFRAVSQAIQDSINRALAGLTFKIIEDHYKWRLPSTPEGPIYVAVDPFRFSKRKIDATISTHGGISIQEVILPLIEVRK